jgi:hypothetical protein
LGQWGFVVVLIQVRDAHYVIAIAAMHKARILRSRSRHVQHYFHMSKIGQSPFKAATRFDQ